MGVLSERQLAGSGGVQLAVRQRDGDGDGGAVPVVLVHGLASNARLWDAVADRLASLGHAVAAVDQRGHGRSDKPDRGYDFATITDDLAAVIGGLGWVAPVVVGQSWGGNVVIELAARRPELVAGAACIDGGWIELGRHFATWDECATAMAPPVLEGLAASEMRRRLADRHADWPAASIDGFMANFEVRADGTVSPWLSREHHMAIVAALFEHDPRKRYPAIKAPVLLVPATGGDGEALRAAGDLIPSVQVHPMAGDHDLHAHHPGEVAELLRSWIAREVRA